MSLLVNLLDTHVNVLGHEVKGWADDATALMMPDIVQASTARGADGLMVAGSTGVRGGEVSFKLLANSKSTAFFMQLAERGRRGSQIVYEGYIRSLSQGWAIVLHRGVLLSAPAGQSLGNGAPPAREFKWDYELIGVNYDGVIGAVAAATLGDFSR